MDITDSGALAAKDTVATADIDDDAVTPAKQSHGTADTLLGYDGSGVPGEIPAGPGITIASTTIAADVASVFGRTGAVAAQAGDYDGLALDLQDAVLTRPEIKDYAETSTTPSSSAGTLDLDLQTGNVFQTTLTEDVTTLNLNNPPTSGKTGSILLIIVQDATGGWSITWPGSVQWPGGTAPTLTGTASSVDIVSLVTRDGGTTWYGFEGGLNFS